MWKVPMNDFTDRIVVVTGASRGIGAATAAEFARRGAIVFATHPDEDSDHHRQSIEQWRHEAPGVDEDHVVPLAADVADPARVAEMFRSVRQRSGTLDVLVNNAGINRDRTLAKMTDQEWREVMRVNVDGTFYCCRCANGHLKDGGRIINISSLVASTGAFGTGNYAASKAAVLGLTRTLALELAPKHITVNAVCPGYIDTDMTRSMPQNVLQRFAERVPLKRMGSPQDVAGCILFLASDSASYITGQTIHVNGGIHMGG